MTTTPPAEVTATDFRANIAEILTNAKYGHPTVITNNAKPIAKVVHPDADDGELAALKAELLAWATRLANATGSVPAVDIAWKLRQIAGCRDHCPDSDTSHNPEGATP